MQRARAISTSIATSISSSQLDSHPSHVTQLMLQIPEEHFGRLVRILVQNKLPEQFHGAVLLSGPGTLVHQRSGCFDSSPQITLPRPLAREGAHSYLEPFTRDEWHLDGQLVLTQAVHQERGYQSALTKDEVMDRNELDVNEGYAVLELHLQKLSKPKSSLEKKRDLDAAFPLSPPHPRPQAEPQK